jgi:hypothetical protein
VVRSAEARLWVLVAWLVIGAIPVVVIATSFEGWWPIGVAIGLTALAAAVRSVARLRFAADEAGVTIDNPLRSYHAEWRDVAEVGVKYVGSPWSMGVRVPLWLRGRNPPGIGVRLQTGREFPASVATTYLNAERRIALQDALHGLGARFGVKVTLEPGDLRDS